MSKSLLAGLLGLLSFFGIFSVVHAETFVSGVLSGDTTWTLTGSPYVVTAPILIPSEVTLTIEPGVTINVSSGGNITASGTIFAIGTQVEPITITSALGPAGLWSLNMKGGGSATFSHSNFSYFSQIRVEGATFRFSRGNMSHTAQGISASDGASVILEEYQLDDISGSGVRGETGSSITASTGRITNVNMGNGFGAHYGVSLDTGATGEFNDLALANCYCTAVRAVQGSTLSIASSTIFNTSGGQGIFLNHASSTIRDLTVSHVGDGIILSTSNLRLSSSTLRSISRGALSLLENSNATVRDITIASAGQSGVAVSGSSLDLDRATLSQITGSSAIMITNGAHAVISNSLLQNSSAFYGILMQSEEPSLILTHSTISGFPGTAIYADKSQFHVTNTTISGNGIGIDARTANGSPSVSIHDSTMMGNGKGITNTGLTQGITTTYTDIDARNNWWGTLSGPLSSSTPFGTGDTVSAHVNVVPFLILPPGTILTPPPCTVNCNSNVMFLPGMMGSRLYDLTGEIIWMSEDDEEADGFRMNSDGTSASLGVTTHDALDTADAQQLHTDVYKSFLAEMKNWEQTLGIIATTTPYDWRLDYDDVVNNGRKLSNGRISYLVPPEAGHDPYLLETLKQLASSSPTGKVTIIGHSQGGLIAKALMNKIGAEATSQLIDKVILVASPQLGTPKAVGILLHGFDAGILGAVSNKKIRELGQHMQSGYNLLPSANYFTYVDDPVITISTSTLPVWSSTYGDSIHWDQGMYNFMSDAPGLRTKPEYSDLDHPEIVGTTFLENARSTHNALDAWVPPTGVELVTIAGWGQETLSGFSYMTVRGDCVRPEETIILGRRVPYCAEYEQKLTFDPNHVIDGDGTVVEPSAHWTSGASSTRYWVDLKNYNKENRLEATPFGRDHKNVLEVPKLQALIANIIIGTSTSLEYISSSAPAYTGDVSRLHFTLHSPLTLGFTDILGNYTGPSATGLMFNIPGVRYERYGEVQWLSVPKNLAGQLVMRGVASGSFTLDVEEVSGNEILSGTSFEGIPSSTSTIVTMDINPLVSVTGSSTLLVDEEGDGIPDITLEAKQDDVVLLPIPTLDVTLPVTTASTTGTQGNNGWYTTSVTVTLTATDTESGVASTTYSLDNGATWNVYAVPINIVTEGITTLLFRSTDQAGNTEATSTLTLKIDKTTPEAKISVSTSSQDLFVEGVDALGTTTVSKDSSSNYIITDQAGHTTKLFFQKTFTGARLTYAKLTGIQYDQAPKTTLPSSSFLYVWDGKVTVGPVSQTIAVDGTYLLQASYDKRSNKTVILVLKKGLPVQTKTFTGLKLVQLKTSGGVVGYSW